MHEQTLHHPFCSGQCVVLQYTLLSSFQKGCVMDYIIPSLSICIQDIACRSSASHNIGMHANS